MQKICRLANSSRSASRTLVLVCSPHVIVLRCIACQIIRDTRLAYVLTTWKAFPPSSWKPRFSPPSRRRMASHQVKASESYGDFASNPTVGTGLGLSLVHSIVTMLDGSIDIKSIQGQGTVVKVTIPMRREQSANSTPSTASVSRGDAVEMLFKNRGKSTRKLYLFSPGPQDSSLDPYKRESLRTLLTTLNGYIEGWYGLSLTQISSAPTSTTPCIVIVDITSLPTFLSCINMSTLPHGSGDLGLRIIVLCDNAARQHFLQTHGNSGSVFFVSKPIGKTLKPFPCETLLRS